MYGLADHMARNVWSEQRGFVRRRQLGQLVLEMDTQVHIYGLPDSMYAICLFSSADNALILVAMERCGMPEGAVSFVHSLYAVSTVLVVGAGGTQPLTKLTCGALQGALSLESFSCSLWTTSQSTLQHWLNFGLYPQGEGRSGSALAPNSLP